MDKKSVKVVRPCRIFGEPREVGDVVEMPLSQALDAIATGRVIAADKAAPEAPVEKAPSRRAAKAE